MKLAQILSGILGTVLAVLAIRWLLSPEESANGLNMVLLQGEGLNTQIRDFTALFLGTSIMCFVSLYTKEYQWILSVGLIYLIAAFTSILADNFYEAPVVYSSLIAEIIFSLMALISAFIYKFK